MNVLRLADRDDAYKVEVVDKLRGLLAAAERGEILTLVYLCEQPDGAVITGNTSMRDRHAMIGHLQYAAFKVLQSLQDDAEPCDLADGA